MRPPQDYQRVRSQLVAVKPAGAIDQDQRSVWSAAHSKLVIDTQGSGARSQAALAAFKPLYSEVTTLQVRHVRIQP
jgi:hypothetical protein